MCEQCGCADRRPSAVRLKQTHSHSHVHIHADGTVHSHEHQHLAGSREHHRHGHTALPDLVFRPAPAGQDKA